MFDFPRKRRKAAPLSGAVGNSTRGLMITHHKLLRLDWDIDLARGYCHGSVYGAGEGDGNGIGDWLTSSTAIEAPINGVHRHPMRKIITEFLINEVHL